MDGARPRLPPATGVTSQDWKPTKKRKKENKTKVPLNEKLNMKFTCCPVGSELESVE